MNEPASPAHDQGDILIPRWGQVAAGLFFAVILVPCLAGSVLMIFLPNEKAPVMAPIAGVVMGFVSLWGFAKSFRLIFGVAVKGGLLSPRGLRFISWLFLLLPVGSLFSGFFATHTLQAIAQTTAYVLFFIGIRVLAAQREKNDA